MPASPRLRRLHHWGSNALIIAQECTARGLRCLHLHVQEHNSKMRTSQGYPRCHDMHASKGYPRRHNMRASKGCPRRPRHTRVCLWRASKMPALDTSSPRRLPSRRLKMATSTSTRAKMHASLTSSAKDGRVQAVTGLKTWSCCLLLSSHVLPHDKKQREEGVGL